MTELAYNPDDWKPGDFALLTSWRGTGPALRVERILDQPAWCYLDETDTRGLCDNEILHARRLLVIDPESNADVERLCDEYRSVDHNVGTMHMQQALRAMLEPPKPPKPDEPLGLGAVVRDSKGDRWVRTDLGRIVWSNGRFGGECTDGDERVSLLAWQQIDAVEVLSEGVTA